MSETERMKSAEPKAKNPSEEYYETASLGDEVETTRYQREGLPRDYRMRHDEHYVAELIASGRMPQLRLVAVSQIEAGAPGAGENLEGLIDSIQEFGVLQPLIVRRERGRYELLSGAKRLAAALSAGLKEVPCLVHDVDELDARRLAEAANRHAGRRDHVRSPRPWRGGPASTLLESTFDTILSTLGLLDKPDSQLRDQVAIGLIRTEAHRAMRLLRGVSLLEADPPVVRRSLDAGALLREVIGESEDERGLLGIDLAAAIDPEVLCRADEQLVAIAFAGVLESIMALLRSSRGARIDVRLARNEPARGATLTASEEAVRMPTASWSRWFDLDWDERPGGYAAGVALLAAQRATELHGGRLEMSPTKMGGCRISLTLPCES